MSNKDNYEANIFTPAGITNFHQILKSFDYAALGGNGDFTCQDNLKGKSKMIKIKLIKCLLPNTDKSNTWQPMLH